MPLAVYLGALLALQAETRVNAEDFLKLVRAAQSSISDVSFVCEGSITFVGPKDLIDPTANLDKKFQGIYVYRSDGALFHDLYLRGEGVDSLFVHSKRALLRGIVEKLQTQPDLRQLAEPHSTRGNAASMRDAGSPNNLLWLWFFESIRTIDSYQYEFEGWEDVDGARCLRARLNYIPGSMPQNPQVKFWIDVARGGHPLRVEFYLNSALAFRLYDVRLAWFPTMGGVKTWIPVDGILDYYSWGPKTYDAPTQRETYHVVKDSVKLNQNRSDRTFSTKWSSSSPNISLAKEFDSAGNVPRPRNDHETVAARLDARLAEADEQAKELDASAAAATGNGLSLAYLAPGVLGVCLLAIAVAKKWGAS